jgi:(2R)-ethylmalonyl-CoA mutase
MGGAVAAIDYMKSRLVEANAERIARIESQETVVVGVNRFTTTEPSPLTTGEGSIMVVDAAAEADQIARLDAWRKPGAMRRASERRSRRCARRHAAVRISCPPPSLAAKAGSPPANGPGCMRAGLGEYRGPTGVSKNPSNRTEGLETIREAVAGTSSRLGRRLKFLVGKPGLDGHSNGAEQIAARARDCGMDITYEGIRLTPERNRRGGGRERRMWWACRSCRAATCR